jgi:hypothetical protein
MIYFRFWPQNYQPPDTLTGIATIDHEATVRIGSTLSGSLVGGNNTGVLNYTWISGGSIIGTGETYTVQAGDFGRTITLEITSSIQTGTVTSAATPAVMKNPVLPPATPELHVRTQTSVMLRFIPGAEYGVNSTNNAPSSWQDDTFFDGLSPSTTYFFFARIIETSTHEASPPSASLSVTTTHFHNFGEWVIVKEATVLEEGSGYRICDICGEMEILFIPRKIVDVSISDDYGLVNFTIVDATTLTPIPGARLFVTTADAGETTLIADSLGRISQVLPVGQAGISVFAEGFLTRNLNYTVRPGEQIAPNIGLSTRPLVGGQLNSRVMTHEEIVEAGIDVTAPGNHHVYEYSVNISFGAKLESAPFTVRFNANGVNVGISRVGDDDLRPPSGYGGGIGGGGGNGIWFPLSDGTNVTTLCTLCQGHFGFLIFPSD